jgi:hypothetical protein
VNSTRRVALVTGIFFVMTFVFSIPGLLLYGPVLHHPDYVLGAGADTRIALGAFFEVITVIANIGTAIVLFPILKQQNESIALGYVASRILESTVIVVGIVSVLSVVTLRQDLAGATGADAASLVTVGRSLVAIHDWTFLLGPAFCAGFGNGLLLGYLMFKSGLVPRPMAILGLVGGPLCFASAIAVLFGLYEQTSGVNPILTIPEIIWEGSLGIYLIVKGFKESPIITGYDAERVGVDAERPSSS